ncbi:MAG: hypothetical protein MJ202_03640 [Lentisphaeria bacterium]|nr:hypothetical protein [Lentisphaeria bacterium]
MPHILHVLGVVPLAEILRPERADCIMVEHIFSGLHLPQIEFFAPAIFGLHSSVTLEHFRHAGDFGGIQSSQVKGEALAGEIVEPIGDACRFHITLGFISQDMDRRHGFLVIDPRGHTIRSSDFPFVEGETFSLEGNRFLFGDEEYVFVPGTHHVPVHRGIDIRLCISGLYYQWKQPEGCE